MKLRSTRCSSRKCDRKDGGALDSSCSDVLKRLVPSTFAGYTPCFVFFFLPQDAAENNRTEREVGRVVRSGPGSDTTASQGAGSASHAEPQDNQKIHQALPS